MGKIKGWSRDKLTGNMIAWKTTNRPYSSIWLTQIYGKNGLWETNIDFGFPKTMAFKTKKEAINNAISIMRAHPRG